MKTQRSSKLGWCALALALMFMAAQQKGSAVESQPMGSSTDTTTGETITVTKNADGTREVVKTDANGKEISRETRGNEPVSKPKPNTDPIGGSSTNPDNGIKTEVILNGDGTRTIIISRDGEELHRETIRKREMLSEEGYNLQRATTAAVVFDSEPVYVERREMYVEREPRFSIGLGFGYGYDWDHCHKGCCAPCPSKKKCK